MRVGRGLGCLTGCLTRLVLILVVGVALIVAIDGLFAPWSFYLGGQMHLPPGWQGVGTMHTDTGDYVLYLWMMPQPNGRGSLYNFPYFRGWAYLCTPRGERFPLRLSASMHEHPGTDTNGMAIDISMYWRPWHYSFSNEDRPRLSLRGRWQNPDLVMDDRGSLSRAFLPDGSVYLGPARNQPAAREMLPIVLHEAAWSGWFSDCRVAK
jgi:hypothetical protein